MSSQFYNQVCYKIVLYWIKQINTSFYTNSDTIVALIVSVFSVHQIFLISMLLNL
jgi:hypothetical protein